MTEGGLERRLRESLAQHASELPPPSADRAGEPLRRGRRRKRLRHLGGVLAVAVGTTLATGGVIQLGGVPVAAGDGFISGGLPGRPEVVVPVPQPLPTAAVVPTALSPAVDMVVAGGLRSASGEELALNQIGEVAQAYRVPGGWVVLGERSGRRTSLWFAPFSGAPNRLLTGLDGVVVASDGRRLAWRLGQELVTGVLADGALTITSRTPAATGPVPVGFVGASVLLRRGGGPTEGTRAGSRPITSGEAPRLAEGYDIWRPTEAYRAGGNADVTGVFGAMPDGRTVVATLRGASGETCLAMLDSTDGLAVRRQRCDMPMLPGGRGWLSPDGRWLVAEGARDHAVLVDMNTAFGERAPVRDAGPGPYGEAIWEDRKTLVHGGAGTYLVRLRLDWIAAARAGGIQRIAVPGLLEGDQLRVVPRLGV